MIFSLREKYVKNKNEHTSVAVCSTQESPAYSNWGRKIWDGHLFFYLFTYLFIYSQQSFICVQGALPLISVRSQGIAALGCLSLKMNGLQMRNILQNKESVHLKNISIVKDKETEELPLIKEGLRNKETKGVILDWILNQEKDMSGSIGKI